MTTATEPTTTATTTGEGTQTTGLPAGTPPEGTPTATTPATTTPEGTKPAESTVPEVYDLKMPEGVELDTAAADEFKAIAKELKLDNASAQKVADIGAKMAQRQAENHAKLVQSWVEQVKTDKDIGGDKFEENLATAKLAMDTFGSPELKDLLNSSGLGNHPAVIKAFFNAGLKISPDRMVTGTPPSGKQDAASVLYGSKTSS